MSQARLSLEQLLELLGRDGATLQRPSLDHGARVEKSWSEEGDLHPRGALATVMARMPPTGPVVGYVVIWDGETQPCFVLAAKLRRVDSGS